MSYFKKGQCCVSPLHPDLMVDITSTYCVIETAKGGNNAGKQFYRCNLHNKGEGFIGWVEKGPIPQQQVLQYQPQQQQQQQYQNPSPPPQLKRTQRWIQPQQEPEPYDYEAAELQVPQAKRFKAEESPVNPNFLMDYTEMRGEVYDLKTQLRLTNKQLSNLQQYVAEIGRDLEELNHKKRKENLKTTTPFSPDCDNNNNNNQPIITRTHQNFAKPLSSETNNV